MNEPNSTAGDKLTMRLTPLLPTFSAFRNTVNLRANKVGGGACSLVPYENLQLSLVPQKKLRCSQKFTFTEFPCSQKFRFIFPASPKIFLTVPYNSSYFIFSWLVIFIGFTSLVIVELLLGKTPLSPH